MPGPADDDLGELRRAPPAQEDPIARRLEAKVRAALVGAEVEPTRVDHPVPVRTERGGGSAATDAGAPGMNTRTGGASPPGTLTEGTPHRSDKGVLARARPMEVIGAVPNRTKVKRRKARARGRAGRQRRSPVSVGWACVLATGLARSSVFLPRETSRLPPVGGRHRGDR